MEKNNWGRIINISSTQAIEPTADMVISSTYRAAISAFSKSASLTLAKSGITINTICPGGVSTDRLISLFKKKAEIDGTNLETELKIATQSIPLGRFATVEEIASLSLYLCSDLAGYITGRVHTFDGGLVKSF